MSALLILGTVLTLGTAFLGRERVHRQPIESLRRQGMQDTMRRAAPVIAAIREYERVHGQPPPRLSALPLALPSAGPMADPQQQDIATSVQGWRYRPRTDNVATWVLAIKVRREYSPQVFHYGDVFVYHGNGTYHENDYGGKRERVGDWAYYWE